MKTREVLALLFATLVGASFLFFLSFAIQPFLPGFQEQMRWLELQTGISPVPNGFDSPILGLVASLTCSVTISIPLGILAFLLWWSAASQRRREQERHRKLAEWSTRAILSWFDGLPRAAADGPEALEDCLEQGQQRMYPYLTEPQRQCFDRVLELVGRGPSRPAEMVSPKPEASTRVAMVSRVLSILAVTMVAMSALTAVSLASFDVMPRVGIPLGPAAVFSGFASWATLALATGFFAFGLRYLDRRSCRLKIVDQGVLKGTVEQLLGSLVRSLDQSGGPRELAKDEKGHQAASAMVIAVAEVADADGRNVLLAELDSSGYLQGPFSLDFRDAKFSALDIETVVHPKSSTIPDSAPLRSLPVSHESAASDIFESQTISLAMAGEKGDRSRRLELWSLLAMHSAVFFSAGVTHVVTLALGFRAGWIPAPLARWEKTLFSMRGYLLSAAPFVLVISLSLGLAWAFWKSAVNEKASP